MSAPIFEAWLAATDDGAIAVDGAGTVVLHNAAASRVTGVAPSAALGRPWREILTLDAALADTIWDSRTSGARTEHVAQILCAQGNLRSAELVTHPWQDAAGATGLLVVIRDLAVLCRRHSAPGGRVGHGNLVGSHPAMLALYDLIDAIAPSDAPVLIEGAPGTGKESVAQLLHARSGRAERPFVVVDAETVPAAALAAELVGERRGGSGPAHAMLGRLELAHTGTLFIDAVHLLPAEVQARLLGFLRAGTFTRVGDEAPRSADVRVIAATTAAIGSLVEEGRFSEELLHRLRVVHVAVPPLRERATDIPALAEHLLAREGTRATLSPASARLLQGYPWPGNVRELDHVLRHAVAVLRRAPAGAPEVLQPEHLPAEVRDRRGVPTLVASPPAKEDRRSLLLRALSAHGGNRTAAARALGIGRATFYRWWNEAGL